MRATRTLRGFRAAVMRVTCLLILAALAGFGAGHPGGTRRALIRGAGMRSCRNTELGMWYVTDDQGTVCEQSQVDSVTGCCKKGQKHLCDTCTLDDKCCSSYEHCVSCCLKPSNNPQTLYTYDWRIPGHEETGKWSDEFEYCKGKCRTHRRSTVHENAYISRRHYCFSHTARPLVREPNIPPIPSSVEVVLSSPGHSCDSACESRQKSCAPAHFPGLNSCNVMRDHFHCEAACEHPDDGKQEPSYVTNKAPKSQRPAACFIGQFGRQSGHGACSWKEVHVQRLCPCVSVEQPAKHP